MHWFKKHEIKIQLIFICIIVLAVIWVKGRQNYLYEEANPKETIEFTIDGESYQCVKE